MGLVVIDGIRDLMLDINNSTEATRLVGDLMKWTGEQDRIATAGIYRKVSNNQVRALRFILSGSHEDMLRIEKEGRLGE